MNKPKNKKEEKRKKKQKEKPLKLKMTFEEAMLKILKVKPVLKGK